MTVQSCMGGWCTQRDRCPNYHAADRTEPSERLCQPGHDRVQEQPVTLHRPDQSEVPA